MTTNNVSYGVGSLGTGLYTASNSTALGAFTQNNTTTGESNVAVGTNALLYNTTGNYNTSLGTATLLNTTTASGNTAVGSNAMEGVLSAAGGGNTAVGTQALFSYQTASKNTVVGAHAVENLVTGNENTVVGYGSGASLVQDGSGNTLVGARTDATNGVSYSTAIGYGASVNGSHQIVLGTESDTVIVPGTFINNEVSVQTTYVNYTYAFNSVDLYNMRNNYAGNTNNVFVNLPTGNIFYDPNTFYKVSLSLYLFTQDGSNLQITNPTSPNTVAITLLVNDNTIIPFSTSADATTQSGFHRDTGKWYSIFVVDNFQNHNSFAFCEFLLLPNTSITDNTFQLRFGLTMNGYSSTPPNPPPYVNTSNTPKIYYSMTVKPILDNFIQAP